MPLPAAYLNIHHSIEHHHPLEQHWFINSPTITTTTTTEGCASAWHFVRHHEHLNTEAAAVSFFKVEIRTHKAEALMLRCLLPSVYTSLFFGRLVDFGSASSFGSCSKFDHHQRRRERSARLLVQSSMQAHIALFSQRTQELAIFWCSHHQFSTEEGEADFALINGKHCHGSSTQSSSS